VAIAIRGAILAGGGATRYGGRPKGLEVVGGVRILDRLVDVFTQALGEAPLLVANAPGAAEWLPGLRVVPDVRPGFGALGGIYTAVVAAPAPVVLAAWDMPFITGELIQALAQGLSSHDAYLPESDGRRGVEPLCAAYGPACGPAIEASFERGDLRAIAFHQAINAGILPLSRVQTLGEPAHLFFNLNTPDDLAEANALWQRRSFRS
jgi:molybdopterin-guanine dinucleotide biosynthesis protein A